MSEEHADNEVRAALIRLNDALCSWARMTGIDSVLILRETAFVHRSVSGKPNIPTDIPDDQLLMNILGNTRTDSARLSAIEQERDRYKAALEQIKSTKSKWQTAGELGIVVQKIHSIVEAAIQPKEEPDKTKAG